MHACMYVRMNCVLIQCSTSVQGQGAKGILCMYVGKSKYSYGLEGKAIAFLWPAEILVASK